MLLVPVLLLLPVFEGAVCDPVAVVLCVEDPSVVAEGSPVVVEEGVELDVGVGDVPVPELRHESSSKMLLDYRTGCGKITHCLAEQ